MKGFFIIASPLTKLLRKRVKFEWTDKCQDSLDVTPRPDEVHNTCNCKGAYVHQVLL